MGIFLSSVFTGKGDVKSISAVNASADSTGIKLPVLMYHSMLKDSRYQGKYVISPNTFEKDLIYIKENGYETVTTKELYEYVYKDARLPKKLIMLTFDDGYYNNYVYAYELLKKYNCKAVISPICKMSEDFSKSDDNSPQYGHCSFDNLKEMAQSGVFEIANHSYDMHKTQGRLGVSQKSGENEENYINLISSDIKKAQDLLYKNTGFSPICFTYPFGAYNKTTEDIVEKLGFSVTLTCTEKLNYITRDKNCLYELGRFLRDEKEETSHLFERIGA
ncbi:MAG: polysaccharide deacetylase family protein [Acutalibacteraceae bacterium]